MEGSNLIYAELSNTAIIMQFLSKNFDEITHRLMKLLTKQFLVNIYIIMHKEKLDIDGMYKKNNKYIQKYSGNDFWSIVRESHAKIHEIYVKLFKKYGFNIACKYETHKYQIDINHIKKFQSIHLCKKICFTGNLVYYNPKLLDFFLDICFELAQNADINNIIELYEAVKDNKDLRKYNNSIALVNNTIKKYFIAHYCNKDKIESGDIDYISMLFLRLRKVSKNNIGSNDKVNKTNIFQSL